MVYDCFTFFNELDLLEIRLNILSGVVDRFVLVEARQSFQRATKPLYYAENKDRFASFADRIDHIVVDSFPEDASGAFSCESWQRNAISRGLDGAEVGDTILISDVDEIPRPECVARAAERRGVTVFRQLLFGYFLNYQHLRADGMPGTLWGGTVAYRHRARADLPQRYRDLRYLEGGKGEPFATRARAALRTVRRFGQLEGRAHIVNNGGWHFSYLGGVESIASKLESFSHVEYNTESFKSRDAILTAIKEKRDLFGRAGRYGLVPLDQRFPIWLRTNATTHYRHLLAPES
jgi:beta-1,4-mannosyl-glycoprotein beta-1,4-N-acetylglucosaminyltransferase